MIGAEGQNHWLSRGGKCLLCAPEHLRPAGAEEISELLKVRASIKDVEDILDGGGKNLKAYEVQDEDDEHDDLDELMADYETGEDDTSGVVEYSNMDWEKIDARRRKCSDDVPMQLKKARTVKVPEDGGGGEARASSPFGRTARTEDTREKQLDAELPWSAIDPRDRPKFEEAEKKQWKEHLDYQAVRVLEMAKTQWVRDNLPKERVLTSRFAYKDKNRPARREQPDLEVKAKARLCVGGHRDQTLEGKPWQLTLPRLPRRAPCWLRSWG